MYLLVAMALSSSRVVHSLTHSLLPLFHYFNPLNSLCSWPSSSSSSASSFHPWRNSTKAPHLIYYEHFGEVKRPIHSCSTYPISSLQPASQPQDFALYVLQEEEKTTWQTDWMAAVNLSIDAERASFYPIWFFFFALFPIPFCFCLFFRCWLDRDLQSD